MTNVTIPNKLFYKEAMDQVHLYNSKLLLDRRLRMPYIDSQTGLAQQDCHLWVSRVQRSSPIREGQVYSYPSRRWRVRKRPDFIGTKSKITEKQKSEDDGQGTTTETTDSTLETIEDSKTAFDTASQSSTTTGGGGGGNSSIYEYYDDMAFDSEFDSDEEFGSRKKKKKGGKVAKGKKNAMALKYATSIKVMSKEELNLLSSEDRKKPYDCQICGKRYKNSQGLRYHYEHHNHDLEEQQPAPPPAPLSSLPPPIDPIPPPIPALTVQPVEAPPPNHIAGAKRAKGTPPSHFCDTCLGNVNANRQGSAERLICCADCGRSAHPSCLTFTEKMTEQVQKYRWQCIECKSCCLCGTSDNDDQLLFCDDCDRGYHLYCLNPPMAEPPEGHWQCQLCNSRIQGLDISRVAVLPEHMDAALHATPSK